MMKSLALPIAAVLVVASALLPATAGAASTTSFIATDDAFVASNTPTRNFGSDQKLTVDKSPVVRSFLKFNLAAVSGKISSATLKFTVAANSSAGFDLRSEASTSWTESTLTWANAPAVGGSLGHSPVSLKAKQVVSFNVTASVAAGTRAFALINLGSTTAVSVNSSENGTAALRPTLVVTYQPAPPPPSPCGRSAVPGAVQHVIWIVMENHGYSQVIGSSSAPFENQIAAQCGLATRFTAESHPSLPNYIAATSGGTQGVMDDASPAAHPLDVPSIFSQVKDIGKTWRSYQQSSPGNCSRESSNPYAVKHDPAAYYTGIRADCANWDVPMGTTSSGNFLSDLTASTLPAFAFVTPNLCNDTHDCSVATGDAWLKAWIAKIVASPGYRDGSTVVVLTWDEDTGAESNRVPTIVISPSTRAGTVSATAFSHYSLLRTTEELLGIGAFLGHAADAETNSMRAAFNL